VADTGVSFLATDSTWALALPIIGIFATLVAAQFQRLYRWFQLRRRIPAYFIIPDERHHSCDFAVQTGGEHRTKEIVVGIGIPIIIDLVMEPKNELTSAQVLVEFHGNLDKKPLVLELYNRFIEVGPRRHIVPGDNGNDDYIDKHKGYHVVENMNWSSHMTKTLGFKILPRHKGTFDFIMTAMGDLIEVKTETISVIVQENPTQYIRYHQNEHKRKRKECSIIGIKPKAALTNGLAMTSATTKIPLI
jgi:hypothetical protein